MEREKEATYNGDDLDCTQPELEFTKEFDSEVVDGDDGEQKHGDPNTRIDFFAGLPFLDDKRSSSQLVGRGDDVFAPIGPAEGKSESRITEACGVTSKTRGKRNPSCHFPEGAHDNKDEKADGRVSNENRAGTEGRISTRLGWMQCAFVSLP